MVCLKLSPFGITNGSALVMALRKTLESDAEPSHPGKT